MHFLSVFATFIFAATASAELNLQKILGLQQQLPKCSTQCIRDTAAKHNCTVIDLACQCKNMQPIIEDVTPCFVEAGCGLEDIANAAKTSLEICSVVAEAAAENSTTTDNPALPKTTPVDLTADATSARYMGSGTLMVVAAVAGIVMM